MQEASELPPDSVWLHLLVDGGNFTEGRTMGGDVVGGKEGVKNLGDNGRPKSQGGQRRSIGEEERVSPAKWSQQTRSEETENWMTLAPGVAVLWGGLKEVWEVNKWRSGVSATLARNLGMRGDEKGT